MRRRAFTLVEVLVVIGVIAILIAVLMPALASVRAQAAQMQCQSNLRQWAVAMQMYAQQNRGYLPRRGQGAQPTGMIDRPSDWFNALPQVMRRKTYWELSLEGRIFRPPARDLWICPAASDNGYPNFFAYGMNMRLSHWSAPQPDRIEKVGSPSTMVFMADAWGSHCSVMPAPADYSPADRHRKRVNLSFIDGHVASFTGREVGCGVGDPKRIDIRWSPPNTTWAGPGGGQNQE